MVPPHVVESRFYSRYITVSRKDGWLHPILDLHHLNCSVKKQLKFSTLAQTSRVSDQVRELVCHDRSKRCTCLHPSSSQEVPKHCFWGQKLTNTEFFLFGLALSPHTFTVCGCCSGSSMIPGHPHTQPHRRLVDASSIRA